MPPIASIVVEGIGRFLVWVVSAITFAVAPAFAASVQPPGSVTAVLTDVCGFVRAEFTNADPEMSAQITLSRNGKPGCPAAPAPVAPVGPVAASKRPKGQEPTPSTGPTASVPPPDRPVSGPPPGAAAPGTSQTPQALPDPGHAPVALVAASISTTSIVVLAGGVVLLVALWRKRRRGRTWAVAFAGRATAPALSTMEYVTGVSVRWTSHIGPGNHTLREDMAR